MYDILYRCPECGKNIKPIHAKGILKKIGAVNENGKYNISKENIGKYQFTIKCPGCPVIYGFNVAA